jgi:acyl-CoA synthetase (AMP-forming)/AMP-acid ligase II
MIIRGGVNIYPNEIEETLLGHARVLEAAVVGLPSPEMGEEVAAFVVAKGAVTAEELIALCRGKLAPYKAPKRIFFVDDMPKNSSGKILKPALVKLTVAG